MVNGDNGPLSAYVPKLVGVECDSASGSVIVHHPPSVAYHVLAENGKQNYAILNHAQVR